jgi:hypothetical protein
MNKIKSFEEACKALNISTVLPDFSMIPVGGHCEAMSAHYQLVIITEALNEGWKPDWNNHNEWKYYPWFDVEASDECPSGSGLSYHVHVCDSSTTIVGSRLAFKSAELAKYAGETFKPLYEQYFLIK